MRSLRFATPFLFTVNRSLPGGSFSRLSSSLSCFWPLSPAQNCAQHSIPLHWGLAHGFPVHWNLFVFLFTKWKCLVEFGRFSFLYWLSIFLSLSFILIPYVCISVFSVRKLFKCVLTKDLLVVLKGVQLFGWFSLIHSFVGWVNYAFEFWEPVYCIARATHTQSNSNYNNDLQHPVYNRIDYVPLFSLIRGTNIIYCVIPSHKQHNEETWF